MKKTITFALILVCLIALGVVCVRPIKAQYNGFTSFAINADGSVSPSTAPIKQTGNIYTLTSDVDGSITVERSNIIFDGNGHAIIGGSTEIGIGGLRIGSLPTAPTVGLSYTSNVTVKNFTVTGSVFGISLWATSNVVVANNTITGTGNGILSLDEPTAGIEVEGGGSNTITANNIVNNYNGILCLETENNLIVENYIGNNSNPTIGGGTGIAIWGASNNTIYHNDFVNNTVQAYDGITVYASGEFPLASNVWDDGYPSGGNYWSDYSTRYVNAKMIDNSGIGNMSYVIDSQNKDRYPLMEPFNSTFYAIETTPPKISILSPLNQTYNESSVPLVFSADKTINWAGYSLDGQQNVTITANSTIANATNGLHSIIVYANDTFGNVVSSETISFTITKPSPIPTVTVVAIAAALAAVIVVAGLFVYFKKRKRSGLRELFV